MAVLTVARFLVITDALAAAMLRLKGDSTYGAGVNATEEPSDDTGLRGRLGDLNAAIMAFAEDDYLPLSTALRKSIDKAGYEALVPSIFSAALGGLDAMCADAGLTGVTGLGSFATYYNKGDGGPWNGLVAPEFNLLHKYVNGAYLSPWNVFPAAIADMGHRVRTASVDAAFVAGTAVDSTLYAGAGVPKLLIADFAGAAGIVQVIGDGRDADGVAIEGHVWSVNVTANGTYTLAPAVSGDLLLEPTQITFPAAITGATATVQAAAPRQNPPA